MENIVEHRLGGILTVSIAETIKGVRARLVGLLRLGSCQTLRVPSSLDVGLNVEIKEQGEERSHVEEHAPVHPTGERTVNPETIHAVRTVDKELGHLHFGDMALPWNLDSVGGEQVVTIHPKVNERVLHGAKVR
jgi:hypothetical protein